VKDEDQGCRTQASIKIACFGFAPKLDGHLDQATMKLLYPASHEIPKLTDAQLAIKIARHSPCSICDNCPGLHPSSDLNVVSDEKDTDSSLGDLSHYGSDDETSYLDTCDCGHTAREHGADVSTVGSEEFARKGRVAVRLDELLQVSISFIHGLRPHQRVFGIVRYRNLIMVDSPPLTWCLRM
jgi:hypothetical protein